MVTQIDMPMRWNSSKVVCVAVSPRDYRVSEASLNASIQPEVGGCGQLGFEQILLHDVQHALQLAEDQNAVLGHNSLCAAISCSSRTQSTVQQQLQRTAKINMLMLLRCRLFVFALDGIWLWFDENEKRIKKCLIKDNNNSQILADINELA